VSHSVQRICLSFPTSSLLALFIKLKSRYLASFSGVTKAKAKPYFLKSRSSFLFRRHAQCKESGFFFQHCACSPFLLDSKAEIEKTAGVCISAKTYFLKSRSGFLFRCCAQCKESVFLFQRRVCSPCLSNSKVDIWLPFPVSLKLKQNLIF
jgi:hypothetical protein